MNANTDKQADAYENILGGKIDLAILRKGIEMQSRSNTVSAIEYLRNRGVDAATIQRVLSGFYIHRDQPVNNAQGIAQLS